jgi:hypothetical protein
LEDGIVRADAAGALDFGSFCAEVTDKKLPTIANAKAAPSRSIRMWEILSSSNLFSVIRCWEDHTPDEFAEVKTKSRPAEMRTGSKRKRAIRKLSGTNKAMSYMCFVGRGVSRDIQAGEKIAL